MSPYNAKAFNDRGNKKYALGDMQGAMQDYNIAIELNPQLAGAFYNRAFAKGKLGDKEGNVSDLNKAGELGVQQAYEMIRKYCK